MHYEHFVVTVDEAGAVTWRDVEKQIVVPDEQCENPLFARNSMPHIKAFSFPSDLCTSLFLWH